MFLYHSTYLENNLHHTCYPRHKFHDWKIELWDGEQVYIHICLADLGRRNVGSDFCHRMVHEAFRVDVALVLASAVSVRLQEVRLCISAYSVSVDSLRCHFGKEGSRQIDFHQPLPLVVLMQPSPFCAKQIPPIAASLPGLLCEFASSGGVFHLSLHATTLLSPFLPYSRGGACLTVLVVPTSLPCHISWHVEKLQDMSCCFWKWESAITSTIYASVASS